MTSCAFLRKRVGGGDEEQTSGLLAALVRLAAIVQAASLPHTSQLFGPLIPHGPEEFEGDDECVQPIQSVLTGDPEEVVGRWVNPISWSFRRSLPEVCRRWRLVRMSVAMPLTCKICRKVTSGTAEAT